MRITRKFWKRLLIFLVAGIATILLVIFGSYYWITFTTRHDLAQDIQEVEPIKTAMVLGTSKRVVGGHVNLFFKYRMEAVKELFDHNKIEYIIVSGDNSIMEYNETRDMRLFLLNLGIQEECIIEDFAGFSTLDSVIRAKEVFGQDSLLIVTQPFHNERAVFIAKNSGINAKGYNARAVGKRYSVKTHLREYLARVKCILDVYILNTMPKFYKDKEVFPE